MKAVTFVSWTALVSKPPDNHKIYNLIGRIAAEWSHVEHLLDTMIWELSGVDNEVGACTSAQIMGATPRFNAVIALLIKNNAVRESIDKARELLRKSFDLGEQRNRFVHDAWYVMLQAPHTAFQYKKPSRRNPTEKRYWIKFGLHAEYNDDTAKDLIEKIKHLFAEIARFRDEVMESLQSSLEIRM